MNADAKLDLLSRALLRPGRWDAFADACARRIPHDEPGDFSAYLRERVANGSASLAWVETANGRAGFVVYSVSTFGAAREFVVLAAFASDRSDLTAECVPQLETLARSENCSTLRFHTMRPGLIRKAESLGFHVSEIILRKTL